LQGLPDDATVLKAVDKMIADLQALRVAPVVDPYTGPAILSGRATSVFFHEVFGHRIEGQRQKNEKEGQTFKKMVGQPVLPDFLSVDFDPTLKHYGNTDLMGYYTYDDEGVKARPVVAVQDGILKNFLMSRTPIDGFPQSNGHGRAQAGFAPEARQSNLVIENSKPVSRDKLKSMLIDQMKEENRPFGLFFDDIEGGFTITGRTIPNAFNVLPVMVYRIYPDGREELVRGVDLIGTPLTVFSKIVAADGEKAVFNGICGAESGQVPVSASGPAILVSQIEVQKKSKSQERSPILPAPFDDK
jgi:TldD protein